MIQINVTHTIYPVVYLSLFIPQKGDSHSH